MKALIAGYLFMHKEEEKKPLKIVISYPWLSPLFSLLLVCLLVLANQPQLLEPYRVPSFITSPVLQISLVIIAIVILFSDIQHFFQQRKAIQLEVAKLEEERDYSWQSKKKLQERTHVYSGHADKLKRFISDKLLEYIEYDEKFLHFKSIAAEVRHNGVISYDIVRTALEKAAEGGQQGSPTPDTFADTHRFGLPNNPNSDYQQALDAMKYLWDLLDLSTADNIALHVGNYLIECEEHYYQQELTKERTGVAVTAVPYKPYFSPSFAAIKTIGPLLESFQMDRIIEQINEENANPDNSTPHLHYHESDLFRINLNKTEHLLGNENHLILLLENLVKNAQFFSTKNKFKQRSDRIALTLSQGKGYIQYKIYNRGPHISEADFDQIFQLGFSTRRVKEHHGKGLGLFFVKEIVKGYQGQITVNNVYNQEHSYSICITLENKNTITKVVDVGAKTDKASIKKVKPEQSELLGSTQWSFEDPIGSIEISSNTSKQKYTFRDFDHKNMTGVLDVAHPFAPEWKIEVKPKRKEWTLKFTPLDVSGIEFVVKLPSAEACLNGDEPTFNKDFEHEVEKLNEQFSEFDDY